MKTLFAVTVFIAGIYLFIQQEGLEKLKQYLPNNDVEHSAELLLANVNKHVSKKVNLNVEQKLEQFKSSMLTAKDERIDALEKQLASLQTQLTKNTNVQTNTETNNTEESGIEQIKSISTSFPKESVFAKTQYLTGDSSATDLSFAQTPTINIANKSMANKNTEKEKAMKRQANLQDIAARMHKTSLLALSH